MAFGLLVGYETRLATGWHHPFVIRWCENSPGDPSVATHSGSYEWSVEISTIFKGHWQSRCTTQLCNAVQGHCAVYQISRRQPGWGAITLCSQIQWQLLKIYLWWCFWNFIHNTLWLGWDFHCLWNFHYLSLCCQVILHLWNSFSIPCDIIFKIQ